MIIHKVKKPFLCRTGQFTPYERELCIGLDLGCLSKTNQFKCYLGNNKEVCYEIKSSLAMSKGQPWKNLKGKTVMIVPLSIFKKTGLYKKENVYQEHTNMATAFAKMPDKIRQEIRRKLGLK
jgi:hypothetical protein